MTTTTPLRPPALDVRGLRKSYGDHTVLDGIDLAVEPGTVHALLGPNGAGKTTVVEICTTLVRPDAGEVRVLDHDLRTHPCEVRAGIAVTGQVSAVDGLMTARENLDLISALLHLGRRDRRRRTEELVERFGLTDAAERPASTYSGGMRRRLDLAMTLVGRPGLLFLDEPTTGLDPRSRRDLWDVVREVVADGTSVLLTTQYLEEADQLADTVSVLHGGRIVASGSPAALKARVPGGRVILTAPDGGETRELPYDGDLASLRAVLDRLETEGTHVAGLEVRGADLDDVFLSLTGTAPTPARPQGLTTSPTTSPTTTPEASR